VLVKKVGTGLSFIVLLAMEVGGAGCFSLNKPLLAVGIMFAGFVVCGAWLLVFGTATSKANGKY
jgi:hypothetical protein